MDIAIIPARGGSKRIPRKNIKEFCGKPLIQYSIEAALKSRQFDEVIISTDDQEICEIAIGLGATVPFIRPETLSNDMTPTVPVVQHAIQKLSTQGWKIDYVACIYATAPFIEPNDLVKANRVIRNQECVYSFPVCEHSSPIQRALIMNKGMQLSSMFPENELVRTQDFEPTYFDAGQFYVAHRETWMNNTRIHENGSAIIIPKWRAVDIDDLEDWAKAEMLYKSAGLYRMSSDK